MKKNLLIAQSGGPTAAINATLAGIIEAAFLSDEVDQILGGRYGIKGILNENIVNIDREITNYENLNLLYQTPGAALASCRFKLESPDIDQEIYKKLFDIFKKYEVRYFIYIGGNDSMDTINKLSTYAKENNIEEIVFIGAPKTIDNDLEGTDHCPGFGSAAKFVASVTAEIEQDIYSFDRPSVTILEIMGRNAGWLTAASALSRLNGNHGPDLIYLSEKNFLFNEFENRLQELLKRKSQIIISVSEGLKSNGEYLSQSSKSGLLDSFNHPVVAGCGRTIESFILSKFKDLKVRTVEFSLLQRAAAHMQSRCDIYESTMLGRKSLYCALEGKNGIMASIKRISDEPYVCEYTCVDLNEVANKEKKVSEHFFNFDRHDIEAPMISYIKPLIQGERNITYENDIPKHFKLL